MVKKYPEIMVVDETTGLRHPYGARQSMDIMNANFRYYAKRIIEKLMEAVQGYSCVIGFQLDNETKHYHTCGENVQKLFVAYLKEKFHGDIEKMNQAYGLAYWSNAVASWDEMPSTIGTINGSLAGAFETFRRQLVTEYLKAQRDIVEKYRRKDQFVTHNLDFEWRGYSYGVQPDVNHFEVAKALTVAGCDIYHPSQSHLTGKEIAFGGDLIRSLKHDNYLVLETQAQGFPNWTPYPGQLKLLAFSHLASGADMVEYWHWHSIHNSFETYWKGVLSHNLKENALYREASQTGEAIQKCSDHILHLKKKNEVALVVSNEALTALQWFKTEPHKENSILYNDIVRWMYDALFEMNEECDVIFPEDTHLEEYKVVILPALYVTDAGFLARIENYVENGGILIATFKTAFCDENCKVWADDQPHGLTDCLGITYDEFVDPDGQVTVDCGQYRVEHFAELVQCRGAESMTGYEQPYGKEYAMITRNHYRKGKGYYIGGMVEPKGLKHYLKEIFIDNGLWNKKQELSEQICIRTGMNEKGHQIAYYLNYSGQRIETEILAGGEELLTKQHITEKSRLKLDPWGLAIIESE